MPANHRYYVAELSADATHRIALDWATDRFSRSKPEIESARLLYIPFCRVSCDYMAKWSAEIGGLCGGDYASAQQSYDIAISAYQNLTDDGPDRNRRPMPPRRADFVLWRSENGSHGDRWQSVLFPSAQHLGTNVTTWANQLLPQINMETATVATSFEAWRSLVPNWQEVMTPICRVDFAKMFADRVQAAAVEAIANSLPKDRRNLTVTVCDSLDFIIDAKTVLPFFLVDYTLGGERASCLVDGISGEVTGMKLGGLKDRVRKTFGFGKPSDPHIEPNSVVVPIRSDIAIANIDEPSEIVSEPMFRRFAPKLSDRLEDRKMREVVSLWNSAASEKNWAPTRDNLVNFINWSFMIEAEYMAIPDQGILDDDSLEMVLWSVVGTLLDRAERSGKRA